MLKEKILNFINKMDISTLIYRFDIPHESLEDEIEEQEKWLISAFCDRVNCEKQNVIIV